MNNKKEYCRPQTKLVNVNFEYIIASSYLEEGIGDGGGPRGARKRKSSFDMNEDDEYYW